VPCVCVSAPRQERTCSPSLDSKSSASPHSVPQGRRQPYAGLMSDGNADPPVHWPAKDLPASQRLLWSFRSLPPPPCVMPPPAAELDGVVYSLATLQIVRQLVSRKLDKGGDAFFVFVHYNSAYINRNADDAGLMHIN